MDKKRLAIFLVSVVLGFAVGVNVMSKEGADIIMDAVTEMFGSSRERTEHLATSTAFVSKVIDGDTIELKGGEHVRYIGVDTPELARDGNKTECYADQARARNIELVSGREVTLVADKEGRDRYGRSLRFVYVDEIFVNNTLIKEGYGVRVYFTPNDGHQQEFKDAERSAQEEKRGLWRDCKRITNTPQ